MPNRLTLLSIIAFCVLLSLSTTANAQHPNPSSSQVAQAKRQGPCSDPWITIAIWDVFASTRPINGIGRFGDCDPQRYNNGSWGSYDELYRGLKTAFDNMSGNVNTSKSALSNGTFRIVTDAGGGFSWTQIISHDGGTLITSDGAGVVASGGGNFRVQSTSTEKKINLGRSVLIIRRK